MFVDGSNVGSEGRQLLVVFAAGASVSDVVFADREFSVVERVLPRLAVVTGTGELERIRELSGVEGVFEQEVPEELLNSLTDSERIAVGAWHLRQSLREKHRPGDGLSWDAEGFEPPDLPQSR